jgi:hypothetical protein
MCAFPMQTQEQTFDALTAWQSALAGLDGPVQCAAAELQSRTKPACVTTKPASPSASSCCQNLSLGGCSWSRVLHVPSFGWALSAAHDSQSVYLSDTETNFSISSSSSYCDIEFGDAVRAATSPECTTTQPELPAVAHNSPSLVNLFPAVVQACTTPTYHNDCRTVGTMSTPQIRPLSPTPLELAAAPTNNTACSTSSKNACSSAAPKKDLYNIAYYESLRKGHAAVNAPVHVDWLVAPVDVHGVSARTIFCDDDFTSVRQCAIFPHDMQ